MKYAVKTENGKYVSRIYFQNGLDFETINKEDAMLFDSKEDAQEYIDSTDYEPDYLFVVTL